MSHTRQLLLCAACANELKYFGDGTFQHLKTGFVTPVDQNIDVLVTGVGFFQTIYHLTRTLQECDYEMVFAAGVAGDYDLERPVCQVFSIEKSTFVDCGFETQGGGFQSIVGSKFLDADLPPFQSGYIFNSIADIIGLPMATANTVCRTCTDPKHVAKMLRQFPADLETMESAAFGYVCARQHVNYAEIRCTSNHVVPKKQEKWQLEGALNALGSTLDSILKEICN